MITVTKGNLLNAKTEALVNTVNTVGVMGKGIALQFRLAYPRMFRAYEKACKKGEVKPGHMHIYELNSLHNPKFIINFPTKRHWRGKSSIDDIISGLNSLVSEIQRLKIKSVAVPPLGCGNGGLEWKEVLPVIKAAFAASKTEVLAFAPEGAPEFDSFVIATEKPKMSRGRALLILLIERYFCLDIGSPF